MRRIGLGLMVGGLCLVGCSPTKAPATPQNGAVSPTAVEVAPTNVALDENPLHLPVTPVIKKRSPEALRQRIYETVARMQADAKPRKRRQALQRLVDALLAFQKQHGEFPQEPVTGGMSWRVALLPFLSEERLHREFRPDESWDSPHHQALAARMPKVFGDDPLGLTRIVMVTPAEKKSPVLLIEAAEESQDFWTKPAGAPHDFAAVPEFVALRDGTVCQVDTTIEPATWQQWVTAPKSEGTQPAWLHLMPRRTAVQAIEPFPDRPSVAAVRPVLPADVCCAIHIEPRRLLANSAWKTLFERWAAPSETARPPMLLETVLGPASVRLLDALQWMQQRSLGVDQLESLTVVVPTQLLSGPISVTESFAVFCRAHGVIDCEGLITFEMEASSKYQYREQGRTAGIIDPVRSFALQFADDSTVVLGGQSLVRSLSEAQPEQNVLTERLTSARSAPLVMVLDGPSMVTLLQHRLFPLPTFPSELTQHVMVAEGAELTFDPDNQDLLTVNVRFPQAELANRFQAFCQQRLEEVRAQSPKLSNANALANWQAAFIAGLECQLEGDRVRILVTRPDDFSSQLESLFSSPATKK